jgi:hypothetical protein
MELYFHALRVLEAVHSTELYTMCTKRTHVGVDIHICQSVSRLVSSRESLNRFKERYAIGSSPKLSFFKVPRFKWPVSPNGAQLNGRITIIIACLY